MIYTLQRFSSNSDSTLGAMFKKIPVGDAVLRDFRCFTLEDERRDKKIPGETRIPAGTYEIKLRTAGGMHQRYEKAYPWHKGMLWLQDVPGFEWIYIHPGNTDDDTSGCILVGDVVSQNVTQEGRLQNSLLAYQRIYEEMVWPILNGQKVEIEILEYA